ncbi:MAG: type II toxin-antitoxin system RelE/ParE family toxin [Devosia sp.]|nr:type II toxin-antitoxin system RelE/ParE family toxin [Devosia sp.]
MKYRVDVSAEARLELIGVLDYLADEVSARAAVQVVDRLSSAIADLGDNALRYQLVPWREGSGIRRRVVGSYNVYYVVSDDVVSVLHVLHGARDHEQLLFPED